MKKFRANVCAVIADDTRRQVLVFRRVDHIIAGHRWQFPQGGLDEGENPEQGLLRELEEEIGTREVVVLRRSPRPIRYVFPPEVLAMRSQWDAEKRQYIGQEQSWFLTALLHGTDAIHFRNQPPEFDAFRWVTPAEAVELVVPFKRDAYREGLDALGLLGEQER